MLLKTILNHVEPFKSFVYGKISLVEDAGTVGDRSRDRGPRERAGNLFGLRASGTGV